MHLDTRPYIFPRQLSRDTHGPTKPRQRLASIHRQKFREDTMQNPSQYNPEVHTYKVSDILSQSRRLDKDIMQERSQLITHSTRVSRDTPDWWKSTFKYFKQSQMPGLTQSIRLYDSKEREKQYDVFNRPRNSYMTIQNSRMEGIYKNQSALVEERNRIADKVGFNTQRSFQSSRQVSPKVGSLDVRDYTIRKPQLKIGTEKFVDTYSVF